MGLITDATAAAAPGLEGHKTVCKGQVVWEALDLEWLIGWMDGWSVGEKVEGTCITYAWMNDWKEFTLVFSEEQVRGGGGSRYPGLDLTSCLSSLALFPPNDRLQGPLHCTPSSLARALPPAALKHAGMTGSVIFWVQFSGLLGYQTECLRAEGTTAWPPVLHTARNEMRQRWPQSSLKGSLSLSTLLEGTPPLSQDATHVVPASKK